VAAPAAGTRIVLVGVQLQMESAVATVALLKNGAAGSVILRYSGINNSDGDVWQWPIDARPKLADATALVLDLSGANSYGYTVYYYTEAV
jgi:hypothetical protein